MFTRSMIFGIVLVVLLNANVKIRVLAQPQVPCFFIFGDSLSDSGNNNNLLTLAKANFLPYGIDFRGGATGRFTNGKTTVDIVGELLGLEEYIPPFPQSGGGDQVLKGVNYASGSAGIRPETGQQVGARISMDNQLRNHQVSVSRIANLLGSNNATDHLRKCIYSVYIASNDWMLNYFSSPVTMLRYTPVAFRDLLITQLSQQLTSLYNLGARKVVLFGVGPLGCLPSLNTLGTCTQYVNVILQDYNNKLRSLVDDFNGKYNDSKFIYINTIGIVGNDLSGLGGLRVKNIPCCGAIGFVCLPTSIPCLNRGDHAYWDNAHPTEVANKVLASRAYRAQDVNDAYPFDISRLATYEL